ncbi:tetratricopeptide repeat protein [Microbulbifer sp. SA54]|uniref:tetratricopeptide repeat protein n=1 Tax=Microbulbifer sp. SA54 TaxID=3401577 RepID=UPI003AAB7BCE
MERFRAAGLMFTGLPDQAEDRRLQIFHFNSRSEFQQFTGDRKVAGFYKETWDGPLIFSQKGSSRCISGNGVMFHEYIHHLMRSRSGMTYPMWYAEGFAELLASATLTDDRISLGLVPEWRRPVFDGRAFRGPLAVPELLDPDVENDRSHYWNSFYASAWLFTHYLQLGDLSDNPSYREQNQNYLLALHSGAAPIAAFEQHFGLSAEDMESELKKYRRGRIRGASFASPPYDKPIAHRKIPDYERLYILADKAFEFGKEELSRKYLAKALKQKPDWRPALSLVALLDHHVGTPESLNSAKSIVANLGIGSPAAPENISDYRTAMHLSHYYMDQLDTLREGGHNDQGLQDWAASYAEIAISLNPESVDAHRHLWRAQENTQAPVDALKTMMNAFQLNPDGLFINKEIGFYLADLQRLDLAAPFLQRVLAWSHPGRDRTRAKNLLARLSEQDGELTASDH